MTDAEFQTFLKTQAEARDGRPYNEANRAFVIDCLRYDGAKRHLLTDSQWRQAYCLCNGFGDIDSRFAYEQAFDWSHVRDSSPIGFDRAANYLRVLGL